MEEQSTSIPDNGDGNADEQGEGIYDDDEPAFIDPTTAVEVDVADGGPEPMSDDDDDDGDELAAGPSAAAAAAPDGGTAAEEVPDMSLATLRSHSGPAYAVSSHLDRTAGTLHVVSGGGDDRAYLHSVSTASAPPQVKTIPLSHAHTDSVSSVAFNAPHVAPDATGKAAQKLVAVGSYDGTIVLYDANSGEEVKVLDGPTDVEFVAFHPKGGTVLLAGSISDGTIWMYHTPTSKCMQVFVGHESTSGGEGGGGVSAGTFTPDGKFALSAGMDGTLRLWAPRTGLCRHVFRLTGSADGGGGGGGGLTCLEVDGGPDGQLAVAGGEDGTAHVVHLSGKKVVAALRHYDPPPNPAGPAAADAAASAGGDGMDVDDEHEEEEMRSVEAVGFAPRSVNPNWVATGGVDGNLKVWDLTHGSGQCRQVCRLPPAGDDGKSAAAAGITGMRWHPSLPLILASYTDGAVRLWDARDGTVLASLTGGHAGIMINGMSVEFVVDADVGGAGTEAGAGGTAIVTTAADDGAVRVYELDVGAAVRAAALARRPEQQRRQQQAHQMQQS